MLLSQDMITAVRERATQYKDRLSEFCTEVLQHVDYLGIQYIILYGSVPRGDISVNSDIDLLFLVDGRIKPYEVESFLLHDLSIENEKRFDNDIAVDIHSMLTVRFINMDPYNVFERNVNEEGVVLWRRDLNRDHTDTTGSSI